MKIYLVVLSVLAALFCGCSSDSFHYSIAGSAILKDKSILSYDIDIFVENETGVIEIKNKKDKINHAIRLILIQRERRHINHQGRLISIVKKILKSQLASPVKTIKVTSFEITES